MNNDRFGEVREKFGHQDETRVTAAAAAATVEASRSVLATKGGAADYVTIIAVIK